MHKGITLVVATAFLLAACSTYPTAGDAEGHGSVTVVESDQFGGTECLQVSVIGTTGVFSKTYCEPVPPSLQAVADKLAANNFVAVMHDDTVSSVKVLDGLGNELDTESETDKGWTVMIGFTGDLDGSVVEFDEGGQKQRLALSEETTVTWTSE